MTMRKTDLSWNWGLRLADSKQLGEKSKVEKNKFFNRCMKYSRFVVKGLYSNEKNSNLYNIYFWIEFCYPHSVFVSSMDNLNISLFLVLIKISSN